MNNSKEKMALWRKNNLDKYRLYQAKWRSKNRLKFNKYQVKYRKNLRLSLIALLGGKCNRCGFSDIRVLQVDHINGGGRQEFIKVRTSGGAYDRYILNEIINGSTKYQLLCANCNWIKRHENKEFN